MTKEQAQKYRDVIKWWIDNPDKGVWWNGVGEWMITLSPDFDLNCSYVQNDEWAEYRKVLADGKQLQYKTTYDNGKTQLRDVVGLNPTDEFNYGIDYYIKPDESKFKAGDWVVDKKYKNIYQIKAANGCSLSAVLCKETKEYLLAGDLELWKPQDGELCVFYDRDPDYYVIDRYTGSILRHKVGAEPLYKDESGNIWGNVAPLEFVQTLMKERK